MKFLVPNYSCLQNPWLGGYRPQSPFSLSSVFNWICWTPPPEQNSCVRQCIKPIPVTLKVQALHSWEMPGRSTTTRHRTPKERKFNVGHFPCNYITYVTFNTCVWLLQPPCAVVMKSGNLNFLEPSGPLQACNGTEHLTLTCCITLLFVS
jgi:hypothetical protein